MSANIQAMIEQGKRALREGNLVEAQQLLLRATELDESNDEAWLWLASAVDSVEEKRICLENVLVLKPNNSEARRMLAELDRSGGSDLSAGADTFAASADASPRDTSAQPVVEFGDSDPFGDIFSSSSFEVGEGDSSGGPFSSDFEFTPSSRDDVVSYEPAPSAQEAAASSLDPSGDLSSLYDDNDTAASADDDAPDIPVYDDEPESLSDMGLFDERAGVTGAGIFADGTASNVDILADGDDFYESDLDDDDEEDGLALLPDNIRPTRLPGSDETIGAGIVVGLVVLSLLNVAAIVGLVLQWVL
jgi:hypothetical protein